MKNIQSLHRRKIRGFALLFAACFLPLLSGCGNPMRSERASPYPADHGQPGTGSFSLSIGRQGAVQAIMPAALAARTIMPEITLGGFDEFDLAFTPIAGGSPLITTWTDYSGVIQLAEGIWSLEARAFLVSGGVRLEAAAYTLDNIEITSGETTTEKIRLLPLTAGHGTFSWNISFPADIVSALMKITRIVGEPYSRTVNLLDYREGSMNNLPAGRYEVFFSLHNNRDQWASASDVLHIYRYLESRFTTGFRPEHFLTSLLNVILGTWEGSAWNLYERGIRAGHFSLLDINGVYDSNFTGISGWFNSLGLPGTAPSNVETLKAIVDASLLGIAGADAAFRDLLAAAAHYEAAAQTLVQDIIRNNTLVDFYWGAMPDAVTLIVGGIFTVRIVMEAPVSVTIEPGSLTFELGDTPQTLTATVQPANAIQMITWSSADPLVATVDADGVVTAVGVGETTIRAASAIDPTVYSYITVTVLRAEVGFNLTLAAIEDNPPGVDITGPEITHGESLTISATGEFTDIRWFLGGSEITGAALTNGGRTLTLTPPAHLDWPGTHRLTVEGRIQGVPFSRIIAIVVSL